MLPGVKPALVIAAIATTGAFASLGTAQAATSSVKLSWAADAPAASSIPTSNIKVTGSALKFVPKTLTVNQTGANGRCTKKSHSFNVTNRTSVSQQLESMGSPVLSAIPPGETEGICVFTTNGSAGSFRLTLQKDANAVLTVKVNAAT